MANWGNVGGLIRGRARFGAIKRQGVDTPGYCSRYPGVGLLLTPDKFYVIIIKEEVKPLTGEDKKEG